MPAGEAWSDRATAVGLLAGPRRGPQALPHDPDDEQDGGVMVLRTPRTLQLLFDLVQNGFYDRGELQRGDG